MASTYSYFNALEKPQVSATIHENTIKCSWPAVTEPASGSGYDSASNISYLVGEGGEITWICPNCQRQYTQTNHPDFCPNCFYSGSDWGWGIFHEERVREITATEYTTPKQVGSRRVWVVARGIVYNSTYPSGTAGWSEPVTVDVSMTGSFVDDEDISLKRVSTLIQDDVYYDGYPSSVSLKRTVYNSNLNPFSREFPESQSLLISASESASGIPTLLSGSWSISGSHTGSQAKIVHLSSLVGYTDAYEYGYSGSTFYFPWGKLDFFGGYSSDTVLDSKNGIVSSSMLDPQYMPVVHLRLHSDVAGTFTQNLINEYYGRRMRDGECTIYDINSGTSVAYTGGIAKFYIYPGLLYVPSNGWSIPGDCEVFLCTQSLYDLGLNTQEGDVYAFTTYLTGFDRNYTSGSRIYPVMFVSPTTPEQSWKSAMSVLDYDTGSCMFTVDDCYLPISV